jgi:hypothetical protein
LRIEVGVAFAWRQSPSDHRRKHAIGFLTLARDCRRPHDEINRIKGEVRQRVEILEWIKQNPE